MALAEARTWLRTPVKWEASLKGVGCDCRGLLSGVARELAWPEAREIEANVVGYAKGRIDEIALQEGLDRLFDRVVEPDAAQAGDILAFRIKGRVQHLAIHAGPDAHQSAGRMIHAYMTDPAVVLEVPIPDYWQRRLAGVWRWKELSPALPAGGAHG